MKPAPGLRKSVIWTVQTDVRVKCHTTSGIQSTASANFILTVKVKCYPTKRRPHDYQ